LGAELVEVARPRVHQGSELGVRHENGLRCIVPGDRDRAGRDCLIEDRPKLVLRLGGGDGGHVHELAAAVAEGERHPIFSRRAIIAKSSNLSNSGISVPVRAILPRRQEVGFLGCGRTYRWLFGHESAYKAPPPEEFPSTRSPRMRRNRTWPEHGCFRRSRSVTI